MDKKYVPLLPAGDNPRSSAASTSPSTSDETLKRKRIGTQACNVCRLKKTRCDGQKPTCALCVKRKTRCVYSDKREVTDDSIEVLEILRTAPEYTAFEILRVLRSSTDLSSVLSMVKGGMDDKYRISAYDTALNTSRPAQSPLEFELMVKNPVSYPTLQPIDIPALEASSLLRSVNVASEGPQFEQSSPIPIPSQSLRLYSNPDLGDQTITANGGSSSTKHRNSQSNLDFLDEPPRTKLCDERLDSLDITFWTNVPIPSDLAAKVISLYLETDHPLLGTFDPGQFVFDLVNHRQFSCSSLLVNALLFWGCQMYTAIEKDAQKYARQLCSEAERIWDIEKYYDTTVNMVAAQLLSLACMGHGRDHLVVRLQADAAQMGIRLGLFGVEETTSLQETQKIPKEQHTARCFAAWGVFNWVVLTTLFYQQPNLMYPKYPPMLPIPGDPGLEAWHEPKSNDARVSTTPFITLPPYMGITFPTLCAFWRIMHGVTLKYFSTPFLREHRDVEFAEVKYRELIAWAENLPPPLLRAENNPHHVVIFHMWLHAAIIDIFRPFVHWSEHSRLKTFSAPANPAAVYRASVNQLKNLIICYRSKYKSSSYTILWHTALTYVANAAMLDADEDPQWRLYFLLCIYGYEALRRPFRISEAIGCGLLTMVLRDRHINSDDAREILRQLKERGLNNKHEDIRATFMGDLMLALKDPERATVEHLAGDFDNMALMNEFTFDEPMVFDSPV